MAKSISAARIMLIASLSLVLQACGPVHNAHPGPGPAENAQEIGSFRASYAIVRPGAAGANSAAYFVLDHHGAAADRLIGASSPIASRLEIHNHVKKPGGIMAMQKVEGGLELPAEGQVAFSPGGLHVMVFGLARPLQPGESVPITLMFAQEGKVEVQFEVGIPRRAKHAQGGH
jgi:periplasmic copper chaperone A